VVALVCKKESVRASFQGAAAEALLSIASDGVSNTIGMDEAEELRSNIRERVNPGRQEIYLTPAMTLAGWVVLTCMVRDSYGRSQNGSDGHSRS